MTQARNENGSGELHRPSQVLNPAPTSRITARANDMAGGTQEDACGITICDANKRKLAPPKKILARVAVTAWYWKRISANWISMPLL